MKYDISFNPGGIQLTLTENLELPEGRLERRELPAVPSGVDLLQQIEARARQFLEQLVADRGGSV